MGHMGCIGLELLVVGFYRQCKS
uniref:Uncharacterized protein n=1 Tax=Rhizophora mucronata TaxID=61149 RepID=A0A2P2M5G2_RHIMU